MTHTRITSLLLLAAAFFSPLHADDVAAFLTKVRSQIAPEAKLDGLQSIRYVGTINSEETSESGATEAVTKTRVMSSMPGNSGSEATDRRLAAV